MPHLRHHRQARLVRPDRCYCGHETCHAWPTYVARTDPFRTVVPIDKGARMADVCEFCPFMGCHDCRYAGGEMPSAAVELPSQRPVDNFTADVGSDA